MKKFIALLVFIASVAWSQFPALSPYAPFLYYGFESRLEANGHALAYGWVPWKTSISLDGVIVKRGDSSVVHHVLAAHGPTNCNDLADTLCQRHRSYLIQRFRGHKVESATDSSKYTGVRLKSPIWTDFWYRYSNFTLRGAPYYDWESPATWLDDSSDGGGGLRGGPVTLARDSAGYILFEHVPTFDSASRTYHASLSNDPAGLLQARPDKWHHIQVYMDLDSANGYGICWVNGRVHSRANIRGMNGTLAQFHAGLYASPAVSRGSIWNDDLFLMHVPDTNYAIHRFIREGQ